MPFRKNKGFTLIEIIVSLLIVSVMSAVAGLGIVQMTNAFLFAKDSAALTQTNQLAMTRLRMSLQNLTSISAAGTGTITIERRSPDGRLIDETFRLSGNTLQVKSSDYDGYSNFFTLADNVSAFSLTYLDYSRNAWSISDRLSDLSRIGISMSLSASEGTSMTFVDEILPSNVYVPQGFSGYSVPTGSTGTTTPGCFVAIAGFEDRGTMTATWCHKAGLIMIILLGWILFMLLKRHGTFEGLKLYLPVGRSGSILIGVIVTIVIIGILGAAMVSLFSSSSTGTIRFAYAQKAQYLAQSGLNYAVSRVVEHRDANFNINRQDLMDSLFLNQSIPVDNDQFRLSMELNWFEESLSVNSTVNSLVVTPPGGIGTVNLPSNFVAGAGTESGDLRVAVPDASGSTYETVPYSGYSVDGSSVTFTLSTSASGTPVDNAPVYPAAKVNGDQTISPASCGAQSTSNLAISGNLTILPRVQGTFTIVTPEGTELFLQYDYLDTDNGRLTGLHCPPGVPPFTRSLTDQTVMTFNEFARFTSTGTVNMGSDSVSRSITLFQPLSVMELYRTIEGEMTPDNVRSIIGSHAGEEIDGDMAIKVTGTEQVISAFVPEDVYMEESLGAVDWGSGTNPLQTLWNESEQKLRYDLQTKIRFTDVEDDLSETDPLNHPGNYMPGLSFRVKLVSGDSGYSYYGLSIMRGIQGRAEHVEGSGCGEETYYTENDDIPDSIYDDHGSTTVADPVNCEGFQESHWDDTPPFDGIPYLVLWQKDATDSGGCGSYSPWERMAYAPLVGHEEVYVYYETVWDGTQNVEVIYEGSGGTPILVWKITDIYGLFKTYEVEDITVLGLPGAEVVRDPATVSEEDPIGKPVAGGASGPVGYIRPPATTNQTDKAIYNYRIYPREWITIMVNIYEMVSDCNPDNPEQRVNALTAFFASPDNDVGTSFGNASSTDLNRKKLDRGIIKWPDQGDYFTQVIWGRGLADKKKAYTSKTITHSILGCGAVTHKLVEIGYDGGGNPTIVYSPTFTTEDYNFNTQDIPEFGAHTLGINANADIQVDDRETVYFDDFAWRFIQGVGGAVAFPGIMAQ
ncbi:MAG: type II secretion system protein [Deltaproteobacteria bacterium]|nr:type II secretion system protein [Deltaproteobacteria bacterium]